MFLRDYSEPGARRGQAMVEFAIIAPLLALFLVVAIDFGRAFFSYVQITNSAREAAALGAGSLNGPIDDNAMRDRALLEANEQDAAGENSSVQIDVECHNPAGATILCDAADEGAGAGNTVTVTVTRDFTPFTPLAGTILGDNYTMTASATAPVLGLATGSSTGGGGGACPMPGASFDITVLSALQVEVDPSSSTPQVVGGTCNLSGFFWDWGDGNDDPGTATAAQHTYANAGTYTIRLDVTNQQGSAATTRQVTVPTGGPVVCAPPTAKFTYTTTGSGSNRIFTYSDQSTVTDNTNCPITAWLWTFHDNGGLQQNSPKPASFKYPTGGSHSVTLQVTNAGGSHSLTKSTP